MTDSILKKIDRLSRGSSPRVLDLFAGCGGLSLGFQRSGFEVAAAIEFDKHAALSHSHNFHQGCEVHGQARDITKIEPSELCDELDLGKADTAFDVVVGGPPCQAYARVGRAKLRDVAEHPEAFKIDERANLYLRYLHYVKKTNPLAVLMENVPDIMNFGGQNIAEEIADTLESMGYNVNYTLMNAAHFGVPQMRDRVFLLGYRKELRLKPTFPHPTNYLELPRGYNGTRAVAFKNLDLFQSGHFRPEQPVDPKLTSAVSSEEAIGDLPSITLHLEGLLKRGARRFDTVTPYPKDKSPSKYAKEMRSWPGFENTEGPKDHVIRRLPRDTEIFRAMQHGDEYPAAHATAVKLFEQKLAQMDFAGTKLAESERAELYRAMVPPYPVSSFPNRWWKLRPDMPSRTLLAHMGKDTYSHIHYDSSQARTVSVREAARLQSFPDGFVFSGTMNPAFRQIGNAVPPILAMHISGQMISDLRSVALREKEVAA